MSPVLNTPVIGYYNRVTQSNLSLASPLDQSTASIPVTDSQWANMANGFPGVHGEKFHTTGIPRDGLHPGGEPGMYTELHSPWSSHDKLPRYLGDEAGDRHLHHHDNEGYVADNTSGDGGLGVLKPEEYLSGLQAENCSVQYAHAPCGRCTRVVTFLLVLMGMTIVGLAVALTVSVLTKSGERLYSMDTISGTSIMEADDRQVTTVFTVQPSFHHRHSTNRVSSSVTIVGERAVTPHLVVRRRW